LPIYLLERRHHDEHLAHTASLFTIHNIEYQGRYSTSVLNDVLGLDVSYFNSGMLEFYGDVNLMKGAIEAADHVTTVSPTYANELHIPFYAHGLSDVISTKGSSVTGILNGIDLDLYNPATDPNLSDHYTVDTLHEGKANCKTALQGSLGLTIDKNIPIIACISRLAEHKGFALVLSGIHQIMEQHVQFVILGTGEYRYEEGFRQAEQMYEGRLSAKLSYSNTLSRLIYAGADLFLMPSLSEPCGLSQMIAMRYGTLPIVRETGGLRDTVFPYNKETGEGRGFSFSNINRDDMLWVIREALDLYTENPDAWLTLQKAGMTANFSWEDSARTYESIYQEIAPSLSHKTGKKRAKAPKKAKRFS
ncbi:MAG: glycogen/starch synthase, partial [Eubacteriales bacterium]